MSRFLRTIVNLVLVCAVLGAAALLIPSFMGIETKIIQSDRVETNLSVGSVTYGKETPFSDVHVGDTIFVTGEDGSAYLYKVNASDTSTGDIVVRDARNSAADTTTMTITSACVTYVTIPYLGYLAILASSTRGWIIIALVVVLLILLFIISEIWRKTPEDEDDEYEEPEEKLSRKEKKALKKQEKQARKQKGKTEELPAAQTPVQPAAADTGKNPAEVFEATREEIASSVSSAIKEDTEPESEEDLYAEATLNIQNEITKELASVVADMASQKAEETAELMAKAEKEEPKEIVIPLHSADELIRKAVMQGDDPTILEDKELGLTLLDYSDYL